MTIMIIPQAAVPQKAVPREPVRAVRIAALSLPGTTSLSEQDLRDFEDSECIDRLAKEVEIEEVL